MTTDRQCKAKATDSLWWITSAALLFLAASSVFNWLSDRGLESRVVALEQLTAGCQEGVSGTPAPGATPPGAAVTPFPVNDLRGHGPLAQSVELRTFNPLSTSNQYQPRAKVGGFPRVFDARSAPGSAGVYADRVSGGCQEVRP